MKTEDPFRRVWSLLDIMNPFHSVVFVAVARQLQSLASLPDVSDQVPESIKSADSGTLKIFIDHCIAAGLTTSAITVGKLQAEYAKDHCEMRKIRALAKELHERLIDEMQGKLFFSLDMREAELYSKPIQGWEGVLRRFPNALIDVEEAGKCLALGRYTAAVFHLMRVAESAVLEFQCFLDSAPDPKAYFGSVLKKLEHVRQRTGYQHLPAHLKGYVGFLDEILPQLHAVKDSWRNKVTHVDGQIVIADVFTEEMALGIRSATLLLMKKLAAGLPAPSV
ncbi:MAG TPA: hypothetical protein VNJ02_12600 [Vicinamibacterales bacterium]|nr:hypothetical protein [Vicinamibacterales bacterium]